MAQFNFFKRKPEKEELANFKDYYLSKPKLNLGSNDDLRPDYINVDIMNIAGLDVRADLLEMPWMPKGIAEEVLAYDLLEHFPFAATRDILKTWVSFLKPEGQIIVRVPDMKKIATHLMEGKLPAFEAQRLLYGGQEYPYNFHMAGFTGDMLEGYILAAGCAEIIQVVREDDTHNVTLVARK